MLTATDITKRFPGDAGPVTVLDGISLSLVAGETLALTGESGSGKSTLLHILAGLEPMDAGQVTIGEQSLHGLPDAARAALRRDHLGIVFQQFNLIPSLNLAANIAFQARLAKVHDADWCEHLTDRLGLADHAQQFPETLSGGQQQRVAIGRALASRPRLVLADEPTGNLDETTSETVLSLFLSLAAEAGTGVLLVTHSDRIAGRLSRRLHLSHGRITE